jgi:hypothetical protein
MCLLANLGELAIEEARGALEKHTSRLTLADRVNACRALWKASGNASDLEEAHRLLQEIRDHAPESYRKTMVDRVPTFREILTAYEEQNR